VDEEARTSLKHIENIIAGSSSRGAAGEHILEEALRHLPPEMLQRNVWVGGKVVELALRLPGGKLLPTDSKWVSSVALEQLAEPGLDANRRPQLTGQGEREVERRVRQVSEYIARSTSSPFALAVIPAAADQCSAWGQGFLLPIPWGGGAQRRRGCWGQRIHRFPRCGRRPFHRNPPPRPARLGPVGRQCPVSPRQYPPCAQLVPRDI